MLQIQIIDEVFIGSCMTNIGHYRAAAKVLEGVQNLKAKLWICPPTKMDEETLKAEGYYKIFRRLWCKIRVARLFFMYGKSS